LASESCFGIEMQRAMQRHETGDACVIPVLIRPVNWQMAPFSHLSVLPTNKEPVTVWKNRDAAFAEIAAGIERVVLDLAATSQQSPSPHPPLVWNAPYQRNPHFTGRDDLLDRLERDLGERHDLTTTRHATFTQPQVIKGLGGIGKTQIAVE